jgi:hypothetical protein
LSAIRIPMPEWLREAPDNHRAQASGAHLVFRKELDATK